MPPRREHSASVSGPVVHCPTTILAIGAHGVRHGGARSMSIAATLGSAQEATQGDCLPPSLIMEPVPFLANLTSWR